MLLFLASVLAAPEAQTSSASDPGQQPCVTDAELARLEAEQKPGSGATLCPGQGARLVHWRDVIVRTRPPVSPSDYPRGQTGDARCVVRMFVDTHGTVEDAVPADTCPAAFRESARRLALRYAYHPVKDEDGNPQRVTFDLLINFRRPAGACHGR